MIAVECLFLGHPFQHTPMVRCRITSGRITIITHLIFMVYLGFTGLGCCASLTPINWLRNLLSVTPWVGFAVKSPIVSLVGHHSTESSPFPIRYFTKHYWMFMWSLHLLFEASLFSSKIKALLLSWNIFFSKHHIPECPTITLQA